MKVILQTVSDYLKNQPTNFYWEKKKEGSGVVSVKKKQISGNRNLSLSVT